MTITLFGHLDSLLESGPGTSLASQLIPLGGKIVSGVLAANGPE